MNGVAPKECFGTTRYKWGEKKTGFLAYAIPDEDLDLSCSWFGTN